MAQHVWKCGTMCRTCFLFHDYIFHCFRCILYIIMMSRACLTCAVETAQLFCMIIMVSFNRLACVNVVTGNSDIIYVRMRNPVFLVWFIVFPIADNIETRNVMDFFGLWNTVVWNTLCGSWSRRGVTFSVAQVCMCCSHLQSIQGELYIFLTKFRVSSKHDMESLF